MSGELTKGVPEVGHELDGRYRLLRLISQTGPIVVFEAFDERAEERVAVKLLARSGEQATARFEGEAKRVRALTHDNTVRIRAVGRTPGAQPYFVMEYVTGERLLDLIGRRDRLETGEARAITAQVLASLSEAHEKGVVHRDLNCRNIWIARRGDEPVVKVLGFGIGKVPRKGLWEDQGDPTLIGAPAYSSPEILRGMRPSPPSDVYSLGLILAEMLLGQPVVGGDTPRDVVREQASMGALDLPEELRQHPLGPIIERAAAKRVQDRYLDASEMLEALESRTVGDARVPAPVGADDEPLDELLETSDTAEFPAIDVLAAEGAPEVGPEEPAVAIADVPVVSRPGVSRPPDAQTGGELGGAAWVSLDVPAAPSAPEKRESAGESSPAPPATRTETQSPGVLAEPRAVPATPKPPVVPRSGPHPPMPAPGRSGLHPAPGEAPPVSPAGASAPIAQAEPTRAPPEPSTDEPDAIERSEPPASDRPAPSPEPAPRVEAADEDGGPRPRAARRRSSRSRVSWAATIAVVVLSVTVLALVLRDNGSGDDGASVQLQPLEAPDEPSPERPVAALESSTGVAAGGAMTPTLDSPATTSRVPLTGPGPGVDPGAVAARLPAPTADSLGDAPVALPEPALGVARPQQGGVNESDEPAGDSPVAVAVPADRPAGGPTADPTPPPQSDGDAGVQGQAALVPDIRYAETSQEALIFLQAAFDRGEIAPAEQDRAAARMLELYTNLIHHLAQQGFCSAAERRLEAAGSDSALLPDDAGHRLGALQGEIEVCRQRVEMEPWSSSAYRGLLDLGAELYDDAMSLADGETEARIQLLEESARVYRRAEQLIRSALVHGQLSEGARPSALASLEWLNRRIVSLQCGQGRCAAAELLLEESSGTPEIEEEMAELELEPVRQEIEACRSRTTLAYGQFDWAAFEQLAHQGFTRSLMPELLLSVDEPPPTLVRSIRIRVHSSPDNARVYLDGERLGRTPFDGVIESTDERVTLVVSKRDHQAANVDVDMTNDGALYSVEMQRRNPFGQLDPLGSDP